MANGNNSPFVSIASGGNAVPSGTTVDKMKHDSDNDASPPKTNGNPSVTPFGTNSPSQHSRINDNGGSPTAKNDGPLSQAPTPSEPQKTKGDDRPSNPGVPSRSDRQSASQGGTVSDNTSSTTALGASKLKDTVLSQTTGNDPLTTPKKQSKTKIGSIFSSVKAKRVDHPSESDAKAAPPRTVVDGEPSAIPSEPSDTSQLSPINSDGISLSMKIDNALYQAPAPSTGSRPYETRGDDKPNNHAQPDRQSASQGGTLPDAPSSTSALGASRGFSPKSFISNLSKPNGGIDPESNADTDPSHTIPPTKTKDTSKLSKFAAGIFKSKRDDDLSKYDADAALPSVGEDRTKPNTGGNALVPSTPIDGDSRAKVADPQPQRDANPSRIPDDAKGIDDLPKPHDERSQQKADSAPTNGNESKTNEIHKAGRLISNDDSPVRDSNEVMDDENNESSESDSDNEESELDGKPDTSPNIIIFGETGVGKSSLIRMLGGSSKKQPAVSGDAAGCTSDTAYYSIMIGNGKKEVRYRVWDTPGLNEGGKGTVPTSVALKGIHDRVQELEGVNLLVYCIRGAEYRDILQVNYDLVAKLVCGGKVPVIAVVSWLENEEDIESWWKANKGHLKKKMKFSGHACVTTTKGKKEGDTFVFQQEYDESKERVQSVITKKRLAKGFKPDAIADVEDALKKYMDEHNAGNAKERKRAGRLLHLFKSYN